MKRQPVRSSVLKTAGYDPSTAMLELEFTSGDVFRYFAIPPSLYRALIGAESPGAFFNQNISEKYPTRQHYE